MEMTFERLGYAFKYFFDADVDEMGHIDVEGYDVYKDGKLVAELNFFTKEEIDELSDDELYWLIEDNLVKE